jgi:mediator of RNA polymerase II transcription subunit 23
LKQVLFFSGLGNAEITAPKGQTAPGSKPSIVLYGESEELNRVVVLTLARAIHINGLEQQSAPWVKEVLSNIMNKTPHSWPSHTLKCFPQILQDFYNENPGHTIANVITTYKTELRTNTTRTDIFIKWSI